VYLRVLEVFDSLQGEGAWAGIPMTFVRLAGCNAPDLGLGCARWCDTKGSWDPDAGEDKTPEEVAGAVRLSRLCLTGGEPLLQREGLVELIDMVHDRGVAVHVETNGTCALPEGAAPDWVTVSPKPPEYVVHAALRGRIDEVKVVVEGSNTPALSILERLWGAHSEAEFCLQPLDGSPEATRAAVDLVMAHPAWRLSLQIHKILDLP
jgi:7-carboxy-7-deazaguanine synthase